MVEVIVDRAFTVLEFILEMVIVPPNSVAKSVLAPEKMGTLRVDTIIVEPSREEYVAVLI